MGGKRLAFVILAILIIAGTNAADVYAQTNTENLENEILASENGTYKLKNDPFLLDFFFGKTEEVKEADKLADPFKELSPEERAVLERWKEKQVEKWATLPKDKFVINASAYTASADECGNDKGITASGLLVKKNQTLACPPEYPFGALIAIEGVGTLRCEDRGGAIKGNHFDIYVETKTEAFAFGRRNLVAEVVYQ